MKTVSTILAITILFAIFTGFAHAKPAHIGSVIEGGYLFNMPFDIALNSDGSKGYVTSQVNACVLVTDLSADNPYVSGQINIPGTGMKQATTLAFNQTRNELYVLDYSQNALFVIDTASDTIDPSPVETGISPQNVIVSPDGARIYVCASQDDDITVINAATRQPETALIPLGQDADPYGMAIANNKLYVAGKWSGRVYVIDLNNQSPDYQEVITTISVGDGAYDAIAHPDQSRIYISHNTPDGKISVIDTSDDTLKTSVSVKAQGEAANKNCKGMTIVDSILFVANWSDSTVTMIDTVSDTRTDSFGSGGNGPENLVASPDSSKLYIVHSNMGSVDIINIGQYSLTVAFSGDCSGKVTSAPTGIDCGSDCTEIFDRDTAVTLSGTTSEPGCNLTGWTGCQRTGNQCELQMSQDITVTAKFEKIKTHTLNIVTTGADKGTITSSPPGILCGIDCVEDYEENTSVTLTATYDKEEYLLKSWSGGGCSGTGDQCIVQMNQDNTVHVDIRELPVYMLRVETTGKAAGTVTSDLEGIDCGSECKWEYKQGTVVKLSASAFKGYIFTGWSGNECSGTGECEITVTDDVTVKAEFEGNFNSKAIIVAGGGPSEGDWINPLWENIRTCANYAFNALVYQGYTEDMIYYLSPEYEDGQGDIDAYATEEKLSYAINTWAQGAEYLVIYMVNQGGPGTFQLNPDEILKAGTLDNWLDTLQGNMPGRLIFIYDACQSGTFIPEMIPPTGRQRIVVTSASDESATFLKDGRHSFSYQFWASIFEGNYLDDAFDFAGSMVEQYQTAQLEADGNGTGNQKTDRIAADKVVIGIGEDNHDIPIIGDISPRDKLILNGEVSAKLTAGPVTDADGIKEVWADILTPCYNPGPSDKPITQSTVVKLRSLNNDDIYETTYNDFKMTGLYKITIYAEDRKGIYSLPRKTSVEQKSGVSSCDIIPPTSPTLKTSDPFISTWTSDNTVAITWYPGQDSESGVSGYSYLMNTAETADPDNHPETGLTSFTSQPLADGKSHYFHIRTIDNAGNASQTIHIGPFYIDTLPPQNSSVVINNNDETTTSAEVILTLFAEDSGSGMSKMRFSNDNLYWSDPENYATTVNWTLLSDQEKSTVYVKFSDAAGNWTPAVSDDIEVNTDSPGKLILVAGGGAGQTNTLWDTTKKLATTAYRIFTLRGFENADMYFMCPEKRIDYNGDGFDDHVVDCPPQDEDRNLTEADVSEAVTGWAVRNHVPETPLFIWLIDHGYPDDGIHGPYFMIAPGQMLRAEKLNTLLNEYEGATGGRVILVNESCYSGEFLKHLKKPERIIVTATTDKIVNYDYDGVNSFTNIFLQKLFQNNTLLQAFNKAVQKLGRYPLTKKQFPQLDDNGDGKYDFTDGSRASLVRLGADFAVGSCLPEITDITKTGLVGASVSFTVTVNAYMEKVWAAVQPPNYLPDMTGDYQQISLEKFDFQGNDDNLVYEGAYEKFTHPGKYIVTFYAEDHFGNLTVSDDLVEINIVALPGDVSADGAVDIADAIAALKIAAGMSISGADLNAAISNKNKIGLEEAVFVLQKLAGIR